MKLRNPKPVFDLDAFLPPDWEDRINLNYSGGILRLDVFYHDGSTGVPSVCVLEFTDVDYFLKSNMLGQSLFQVMEEPKAAWLGSLIEYQRSDWPDMDTSGSGWRKHYRLFLRSVGIILDVSCRAFTATTKEI